MLDDLTVFYDHLHSQKLIYKKLAKAYIIPRKLNIVPYTMGNSKRAVKMGCDCNYFNAVKSSILVGL